MAPNPDLPSSSGVPPRFSASHLPADADPAEREFVGLLHKALAPSYVLIRRLGAGGMGTVYVARDPVLKRLVAVKVMSPDLSKDPEARARFQREAQAVAAISHPNVVAVFAVGELENGLPFLVMQYVEGRSMEERVADEGPLDVPTAKRVLGEVASALSAAHAKGVIHRDIKPANILWDDETGRALVADFGIAAVRERPDERDPIKITQTGMSVGTPAYMSPEQLLAERVTEKTDIYALGLLGYELLTGQGPYAITSPRELMAAHLRDEPRPITTLRKDADPELERLLTACLTKDPAKRPGAADVAAMLTHGASVLLEWPPPGLEQVTQRFRALVRALTVGGLLIGLPLIALSSLDYGSMLRQALPSAGALFVITGLGLVTLIAGGVHLVRLFRDARRAVSRGYGWLTVAEVTSDARGDGGALIAGGREYAALTPAHRDVLRRNRLTAGGLQLAGALTPIFGYLAGLVIAVRFGGGTLSLVFTSVGLTAALFLFASAAGWSEQWKVRTSRSRLAHARAARAAESRLGDSWTATFDAVRSGQRLGPGLPHGLWRNRLVVAVAATTLALGVAAVLLAGYSAVAIGSLYEVMFSEAGLLSTNVSERVRRITRLERLRLPMDTSITPVQAGDALRAMAGRRLVDEALASAAIGDNVRRARSLPGPVRDTLRLMASRVNVEPLRRMARAQTYDYLGAMFTLPQLDMLSLGNVPIPRVQGFQNAANANIAAGILAFASGRASEAEMRFRETLSAGFLLVREGNWLAENWAGVNAVERARLALAALYQETGRTADATFASAASDPPEPTTPERVLPRDLRERRLQAFRVVRDTTAPRGLRNDVLRFTLAYWPCSDLRQIVFGVDPRHTRVLEVSRPTLVRFPSDSLMFLKVSLALERPLREGFIHGGSAYHAMNAVAKVVDFLTGSRRMQSCVSMVR